MATAQPLDLVDQNLVVDLGCLDAQQLPVVGGKAANLGELIRAGFPVPPGFCLTTAAYQHVAADAFDGDAPDPDFLAAWIWSCGRWRQRSAPTRRQPRHYKTPLRRC